LSVLLGGERSLGGLESADDAAGAARALQCALEAIEFRDGHGYITAGANGSSVLDQAFEDNCSARIGLHELGEA
jgi:hypothetical protein